MKTVFNKNAIEMWRELERYLVGKGLRTTSQRRAIVDAFVRGKGHLSVEDVLARARKIDRRVGYATVYRTLRLLSESGLAQPRQFGDGVTRYEVAAGVHHHDHLICEECGTITEFEEPRIEELQDEVAARYGFELSRHKHELYGSCARCRRKTPRGDRERGRGRAN